MREAPLALHLKSFSGKAAIVPALVGLPMPEPAVTLSAAELEQRVAKAARDSEAAAMAECERRLLAAEEAHRVECAAAIEAARGLWIENEANTLAAQLEQGLAALRSELCEQIANALRHVLTDHVVARALELFGAAIDQVLGDAQHPAIVVKGPADLLTALEAIRGPDRRVSYEPASLSELVVKTDQAQIETTLNSALMALAAEG